MQILPFFWCTVFIFLFQSTLYSQVDLENQEAIQFKNNINVFDGSSIIREAGNALRIKYISNGLIFDALDDQPIWIRNSSDNTKIQLNPFGDSFFNGGNVGIGTQAPNSLLELNGSVVSAGTPVLSVNNTFAVNSFDFNQNRPFAIRRHQSDHEALFMYLLDGASVFTYNNDESTSEIRFRLINNDLGGSGANANDNYAMTLKSGPNGSNVGIGIENPAAKLDIRNLGDQSQLLKFSTSRPWVFIQDGADGPGANLALKSLDDGMKFIIQNSAGENQFIFDTNSGGILNIKGKVHTSEVVVDLNVPGPDYVFEEDYPLQDLSSLEQYLKQNKHLPEVPSAAEMKEEGIKVGEMEMLLLKKVEELTLHIIELEKRINDLEE